jgi:hypothetical protein
LKFFLKNYFSNFKNNYFKSVIINNMKRLLTDRNVVTVYSYFVSQHELKRNLNKKVAMHSIFYDLLMFYISFCIFKVLKQIS